MLKRDSTQRLALFYEAQDATLKALGRDARLRFLLGRDKSADDSFTVRCHSLGLHPTTEDVSALRGAQDRLAVLQRFAWAHVRQFAREHHSPDTWHADLEQIRVEALACKLLKGVKIDLQAYYRQEMPNHLGSGLHGSAYAALIAQLRLYISGLGSCLKHQTLPESDQLTLEHYLPDLRKYIEQPLAYHQSIAKLGRVLSIPLSDAARAPVDTAQNIESEDQVNSRNRVAAINKADESQHDNVKLATHKTTDESGYRIYTSQFDEQCNADTLADRQEQLLLRQQLDGAIREVRPVISRLAGRLLNTLYASVDADWELEQEEGLLDTVRLDRLVTQPLYNTPYRLPRRQDYRDTVVSLLIDNSGSMRGHPITVAAMCADLLARTLERCGVGVEILGFTTGDWQGGRVRRLWVENGKPAAPGRLNSLRHIIYKSVDQSWRQARYSIGVMLKEDLLRENIDGEALCWAYGRLQQRPESRRILIVVSDGAPSDEATDQTNPSSYLQNHLHSVVRQLENNSTVELFAIGIGYEINAIYRNAVMIPSEGELGDVLVSRLCDLFNYGRNAGNTSRKPRSRSLWAGAARRSLMI